VKSAFCAFREYLRPWDFIVVTDKALLEKLSQMQGGRSQVYCRGPLTIVVTAYKEFGIRILRIRASPPPLYSLTDRPWIGILLVSDRREGRCGGIEAEDTVKGSAIPEKYCVECIVAIGYPDFVPKPHEESKLLYEKVHGDTFGSSYTVGE
jgi:hypothetical protein